MITPVNNTRADQAQAFMSSLHEFGWSSISSFEDGGHVFEMLTKGAKTLIVQFYPSGHGFEVWRPVTSSASIAETRLAVEQYANEVSQ